MKYYEYGCLEPKNLDWSKYIPAYESFVDNVDCFIFFINCVNNFTTTVVLSCFLIVLMILFFVMMIESIHSRIYDILLHERICENQKDGVCVS